LKGINGPSKGPAKAPVTIVEFSDLQCPHCKDAQPVIEKLLAAEPNARFVFQNYPLPMHNWAAKGAAYADCVGRASSDAFWKFIQGTFDEQPNITESNADEKLTAIADTTGVKGADIAACAAKPDTRARIQKSVALGEEVGVTGTPAVYINGRKIGNVVGIPEDVLKGLVEFAAKQ
jgi:protein-disulfide isomerase